VIEEAKNYESANDSRSDTRKSILKNKSVETKPDKEDMQFKPATKFDEIPIEV
jgi:hypothetical protein